MRSFLILGLSLSCSSTLTAQIPIRVVPESAAKVEGSTQAALPFAYQHGRTQQILRGSAVTKGAAVINLLSFRRDINLSGNQVFQPLKYSGLDLRIGATTVAPENMSTSFAANLTSNPTQVLSGAYSLPTLPPLASGPAPFLVRFSLQRPAVFSPANGNLLIDLTLPGAINKHPYFVDAEYAAGSGTGRVNPFGVGGSFSQPETYRLSGNPSTLRPGGTLDLFCSSFNRQYTGTLILGLSATSWGSVKLPLDLGFMGATGNALQVSMDLTLPFNTKPSSRNYISRLQAPIPSSAPASITVYAQAYYLDAKANAAGLVATGGLALNLDSNLALPEINQMGSNQATAKQGSWLVNGRPSGAVVQLIGSF